MVSASVIGDFIVPPALEAAAPPEARGLRRDEVRLLVSRIGADRIEHARFRDLPGWLSPGDLLVVNTSATINASLPATNDAGESLELHLSTGLPGGFWVVEVRALRGGVSLPYRHALSGTTLCLPDGGEADLLAPYPVTREGSAPSRLWLAALTLPEALKCYLDRAGAPIRYSYVSDRWPLSMYQTIFATEPGSAEMPSAGRPFTAELVTTLVSRGIQVAPLLLHTGVASLEDHEPPYEEFYRVPRTTADRVNATRATGGRVIAVGTTVVRAMETVTDDRGHTSSGEGWTSVVVSRDRPIRSVDGLITGLHEPKASHLRMLEQVVVAAARTSSDSEAARRAETHLMRAYEAALETGYLWHEFGDSHLIL
jgi:S-adenosylmethionine:tRNA ribosyltransferase-isomerase